MKKPGTVVHGMTGTANFEAMCVQLVPDVVIALMNGEIERQAEDESWLPTWHLEQYGDECIILPRLR